MRQKAMITICVLILFIGLGLIAYPTFAQQGTSTCQSKVISEYEEEMKKEDKQKIEKIEENAREFNQKLASGKINGTVPTENGYYEQLLLPNGPRIMGYIHIPKIDVHLPIYHGCSEQVLRVGCGHLPQSSLPIGGKGTHSMLCAHSGMAAAAMFTELPNLKVGDVFYLEILGKSLKYRIQSEEDIRIILPTQGDTLSPDPEEDACTLITCVPRNINSHRLLVTGHRIL